MAPGMLLRGSLSLPCHTAAPDGLLLLYCMTFRKIRLATSAKEKKIKRHQSKAYLYFTEYPSPAQEKRAKTKKLKEWERKSGE